MSETGRDVAMVGCLMSILRILIQVPMLVILLYWGLRDGPTPDWVWWIFWSYIPVGLFLGFFSSFVEAAAKLK